MTKLKNILKRLSLVLFGLVSAFLILEIALIVLEPHLMQGFYMYDQELGFRVRPHMNGSNEFGFNDDDYPLEKPADTYRILFLGDSFSWAGGKNDNYVGVIRRLVKARFPDRNIDVINAGYPMTHTGEQLDLLKRFGLKYEPDLVVLGFFAGNDFINGDPYRKRIVLGEAFVDIDKRDEVVLFGYPILAKSRLIEFIRHKVRILSESAAVAKESKEANRPAPQKQMVTEQRVETRPATGGQAGSAPSRAPTRGKTRVAASETTSASVDPTIVYATGDYPGSPTLEEVRAFLQNLAAQCREDTQAPAFTRETQLDLVQRELNYWRRDPKQREFTDSRVQYILGKVDEMADLLSERGIKFLVAIHPAYYQVDPELARTAMELAGRTADEYGDLDRPQALLRSHLQDRKIPFFDLLEPLREAHRVRPTYLPHDTHWNYFGNSVAGHVLFLHLLEPLTKELNGG